jgi:hypothetical protein
MRRLVYYVSAGKARSFESKKSCLVLFRVGSWIVFSLTRQTIRGFTRKDTNILMRISAYSNPCKRTERFITGPSCRSRSTTLRLHQCIR